MCFGMPGYLKTRDPVLFADFSHPERQYSGEQRLMRALLLDAIRSLNSKTGKNWRRVRKESRRWILNSRLLYFPVSFETCCVALYLDPSAVRKEILTRRPNGSKEAA